MNPADINEREIFVAAHQLKSDEEREVYLQEACAGRPELLERVRSLFKASANEDDFLLAPDLERTATFDDVGLTEGIGVVMGRYKLLERIGEGGMAVVYMAQRIRTSNLRFRRRILRDVIQSSRRFVTALAVISWSVLWATGWSLDDWHILAGNGTLWTPYRAAYRARLPPHFDHRCLWKGGFP